MLSRPLHAWLLALADPSGLREPLPDRRLKPADLPALRELAERHAVLPAVTAHVRGLAADCGVDRLLHGDNEQAARGVAGFLDEAGHRLAQAAGMSLLIRAQAAELGRALVEAGAPAMLLKGADFADRLYAQPALRPFTDLDVLVPAAALAKVEQTMRGLHYQPAAAAMKRQTSSVQSLADTGYGELAWNRPSRPSRPVEIHTNLVNSPSLRRGLSVAFDNLPTEPPAERDLWRRPSVEARLLIAAVHGAAGHGFDRLSLLYDVVQCARGADGTIDPAALSDLARRTGAGLALMAALRLAGRTLHEPRCEELLARLSLPPRGRLWKLLLTPGMMLRPHARRDSLRRQAFRQMLKKP